MGLVKLWQFYHVFILGKIGQENVFHDISKRKNASLDHKNKNLKYSKNWHFSKGVSRGFWSKITNFSIFYFSQKTKGKCVEKCLTVFQKEKTAFYTITTGNSRTRKSGFFQRGKSMVLIKQLTIFPSFYFTQKRPKNVFHDNLERENAFLDHNNNKLKNSKNWDFSKRVSPQFWLKIGIFSRAGKCVPRYFKTNKMPFQTIKTKSSNIRKIGIFLRCQSMFLVKNWQFFQSFDFLQKMPGKCVLRYSRKKKRPSSL